MKYMVEFRKRQVHDARLLIVIVLKLVQHLVELQNNVLRGRHISTKKQTSYRVCCYFSFNMIHLRELTRRLLPRGWCFFVLFADAACLWLNQQFPKYRQGITRFQNVPKTFVTVRWSVFYQSARFVVCAPACHHTKDLASILPNNGAHEALTKFSRGPMLHGTCDKSWHAANLWLRPLERCTGNTSGRYRAMLSGARTDWRSPI